MPQDLKECLFKDVPVEGLFVEVMVPDQPTDFDDTHDVYRKCSDHDIALVGSIIEGVVYPSESEGAPSSDHIDGFSHVIFVSQDRIACQAA